MRQRLSTVLVTLVLLSVAVAGCLDNEAKVQSEARKAGVITRPVESRSLIEQRIDARITTPSEPSLADWTVLSARAGPAGNLTGFRWPIPPGGIIGGQFLGQTGLFLEVAPIVVGGATIQSWCILAFRQDQGKAVLVGDPQEATGLVVGPLELLGIVPQFTGVHCASSEETIIRSPGAPENRTVAPAAVAPFFFRMSDVRMQELQDLFFVVAAVADKDVEFGLGLRVLTQYPSPTVKPAESLDLFLSQVAGYRPRSTTRLGSGTGLLVAQWVASYGLVTADILSSTDRRQGPLQFSEPVVDGRPVAGLWNFNVTSSLESPGGWSVFEGHYISYCAQGRYVAAADLNGNGFVSRNLILQHPICGAIYPWVVEVALVGMPMFAAYGGGDGASTASLELLSAGALGETLYYRHVAIGAKLEDVLRMPSISSDYVYSGVLKNVPP